MNGFQALALAYGKTGCYLDVLIQVIEIEYGKKLDRIRVFKELLDEKKDVLIREDCFVLDAGGILSRISKDRWIALKSGPGHELPLDYKMKPGEYEAVRYQRRLEKGEKTDDGAHFVRGDGTGRLAQGGDPMGESKTVREGWVVSRRIFRRVV